VLSAPPGSGKTTIAPLWLIDQPWLRKSKILMLEPRRLAARASAARMADLLGESVGDKVGYRVRFEHRVSRSTRIEVITEGILTRRLQQDPELKGVGLIIFDEFHERSLQADLALAFCLDVRAVLRSDLRLLVMSATLDCDAVSRLLDGAPVITGTGLSYPVDIHYLQRKPAERIPQATTDGILQAVSGQAGDILVFLPGMAEIRSTESLLRARVGQEVTICPLFGDLDRAAQERAIQPDPKGRRRIVLATSIAETSLTIEGIGAVVDAGWSRLARFDPNTGLTRLVTLRVSLDSADQRCGRAGRLGPGVCYRLWTSGMQATLSAHTNPELLSADLATLVLELAQWGVMDSADLSWLNQPPAGAFSQARELLRELHALDDKGRITSDGRQMATMAVHPRLARMLLKAGVTGQLDRAADIAALLSERDIVRRGMASSLSADIEERLNLLALWRREGKSGVVSAGGESSACARVDRLSQQLKRVKGSGGGAQTEQLSDGALLATAYPDRIARRREGSDGRYLLVSGRGVRLPHGDPLVSNEYLAVASLDAGRSEGRVFMAAELDLEQIRQTQSRRIDIQSVLLWETSSKSVVAQEEERLGSLLLSSRVAEKVDADAVCSVLLQGIRAMGLASLPWNPGAREWQARLLSLRCWQPDAAWPDLSDDRLFTDLEEWLVPWLNGISRAAQLKRLDLESILKSQLDWRQQQRLKQLAPTHIQVPSGSRRRLIYQPGEPPVLKVKLQEMFGLADTPTVCQGQVPVVLHLLSPAQRPIQVTQDLRGFWERTYQEVRKELKGRYPKHYWPEDPWKAQPTARLRPASE